MVSISVDDGTATFDVLGLHRLWALRRRVRVPLSHIASVRADPTVSTRWGRGIRFPGTHVPGLIKAGTYYQGGKRLFWDVVHPAQAIVIELRGDRFDELVVEVADPGAAVAQLQTAIERAGR
jgi:hypothetical protein